MNAERTDPMTAYRKRPVQVDAMQFTGDNLAEMCADEAAELR